MPDNLTSLLHLKPWATTFSSSCGCALERRPDGGVALMSCEPHARAFRAVCGALASGRRLTQAEIRQAAFGALPDCPEADEDEPYDCPIHGTAANDGGGGCARC